MVLPEAEVPTGDFTFIYTTEKFDEPSLVRGHTDVSDSCLLSFIPRFSQLSINDAEKKEREKKDFETNLDRVTG